MFFSTQTVKLKFFLEQSILVTGRSTDSLIKVRKQKDQKKAEQLMNQNALSQGYTENVSASKM